MLRFLAILSLIATLGNCKTMTQNTEVKGLASTDASGVCSLVCEGQTIDSLTGINESECTSENAANIFPFLPRCPYRTQFSETITGECTLTCESQDLDTVENINQADCTQENARNIFSQLPRCPYDTRFDAVGAPTNDPRVRCYLTCEGTIVDSVTTGDSQCTLGNIGNIFEEIPRCGPELYVYSRPMRGSQEIRNGELSCNDDGSGTWYVSHVRSSGLNLAPNNLTRNACEAIIDNAMATRSRKGNDAFFCMQVRSNDGEEFHMYNSRNGNDFGGMNTESECRRAIEGMLVLGQNDSEYSYEFCRLGSNGFASSFSKASGNYQSSGRFSASGSSIEECNRDLRNCRRLSGYTDLCGIMGFCMYPRSGTQCENQ